MVDIIPESVIEPSDKENKLSRVAELPQDTEAAVETFKTIGTKIRSEADFPKNYVDRIPVRYGGEYKKLYRGIAEGIELKEIKLQQRARIFYFDIEPERTLYVVVITENHLETDKIRR